MEDCATLFIPVLLKMSFFNLLVFIFKANFNFKRMKEQAHTVLLSIHEGHHNSLQNSLLYVKIEANIFQCITPQQWNKLQFNDGS